MITFELYKYFYVIKIHSNIKVVAIDYDQVDQGKDFNTKAQKANYKTSYLSFIYIEGIYI